MTIKQYFSTQSLLLIILVVLGFIGVLGPDSQSSIFGQSWWLDYYELALLITMALAGLIITRTTTDGQQRIIAMFWAFLTWLIGTHAFVVQAPLLNANLESPGDVVLFLFLSFSLLYVLSTTEPKQSALQKA